MRGRALMLVSWLAALPAGGAQADSATARDKREARLIFDTLGRVREQITKRCGIGDRWYHGAVPYETARRYLGLTLRADVVVENPQVAVHEVIDPGGKLREAFCSGNQEAKLFAELKREVESAPSVDDFFGPRDPLNPIRPPTHESFTFSFPVFDRAHRRAVVISVYSTQGFIKSGKLGEVRPCCSMLASDSHIFAKRRGEWTLLRTERLWHAH